MGLILHFKFIQAYSSVSDISRLSVYLKVIFPFSRRCEYDRSVFPITPRKEITRMSHQRANSPTRSPLIFPRTLSAQSFTFRYSILISIAMATTTSEGKVSCVSPFSFFFFKSEIVGLAQQEVFKACCWLLCRLMNKCILNSLFAP